MLETTTEVSTIAGTMSSKVKYPRTGTEGSSSRTGNLLHPVSCPSYHPAEFQINLLSMAPNGTRTSTSSHPEHTSNLAITKKTSTDQPCRTTNTTTTTTDAPVLNVKSEYDRRKTYENWPLTFLDPNSLAAAGFYYLKKADLVRCAFCNTEIGHWEPGDDPMRDHQRWSPNCPYVKNQNVGNVPLGQEEAPSTSTSTSQGHDTCGPYGIVYRPFSGPENGPPRSLEEKHGIHKSTGPLHKDFSTLDARLRSYKYWPVSLKQKPNVLSDAGFYYTGKGDQTVCFHCGGGLKDWEDSDDPWVEHALWFSKCLFVNLVKGPAFVEKVCAEKQAKLNKKEAQELESPNTTTTNTEAVKEVEPPKPVTAEPVSMVTEEPNGRKSDDARLCKICYTEELGVLFLPCGHIVACVHCAPALSVCAVCCQPFTATVRAYLP